MRRVLALLVLALAGSAGGCGGSHRAAATNADPQVDITSCAVSSGAGKQTSRSCTFVLTDGRRFRCNRLFTGPGPAVAQLERMTGCRQLPSLVFSAPERALIVRLDRARSCLTEKDLHVLGGPTLPESGPVPPPSRLTSIEPDGELVISSTSPTFIAFYTTAARARRIEPALRRSDAHAHVELERRGAVTIAWSRTPTSGLRNMVWTCLPQ